MNQTDFFSYFVSFLTKNHISQVKNQEFTANDVTSVLFGVFFLGLVIGLLYTSNLLMNPESKYRKFIDSFASKNHQKFTQEEVIVFVGADPDEYSNLTDFSPRHKYGTVC